MSAILFSMALVGGAVLIVWRALWVIDAMSDCTCGYVRWSWIAMAVAGLWVICAVLTGDMLVQALIAFFIALGWVSITDRRWRPRMPAGHRRTSLSNGG